VCRDRHPLTVDEDAQDSGLRRQLVEAGELGGTGVDQLAVSRQVGVSVFARGSIGFRALALLQHQLVESRSIYLQAGFGRHLQGELDRESVGVVQGEGIRPGQHASAR
jgi:hypothetical protein